MKPIKTKKFKVIEKKTKYNDRTELEVKVPTGENPTNVGALISILDSDGFKSIRLTDEQLDKLRKFLK